MNETNIVINVGIGKLLAIIVSVCGTLIGGSWYISSKLTKVETKVGDFESRLTTLTGRFDLAYSSSSPISLKPKGNEFLENSGLKKYIEDKKDWLLSQCQSEHSMSNQYDIQESAFRFFDNLDFGDFETTLKDFAYKYGWSMETVRRIGGIYFRDICLIKKGLKPEDLDKPKL
jgi:hypothetical protein